MIQEETISAISTAVGEAGIGIVRMSGENAIEIADKIFKSVSGKKLSAITDRKIIYGTILDSDGTIIDEGIVLVMRSPNSYTREDVVELQCHGGVAALKKVLLRTIEAGARLSERGEFTKRAFLNGRLDLSRAQAVLDIIQAKTDTALKMAEEKLSGKLSKKIHGLKQQILNITAHIEAIIDFPEDDIDNILLEEITNDIKLAVDNVKDLLENETKGKILKEGIDVAIIGKPNVGKSSLLNFISQKEKAIVTEIPGTTRDTIEEFVNIEGIPIKIVDTAGIRQSKDQIEKIGIQRSKEYAEKAALVLALFDGSRKFDYEDEEIFKFIKKQNTIFLITKSDLPQLIEIEKFKEYTNFEDIIFISVKNNLGVTLLYKKILQKVDTISNELKFIKSAREIEILNRIEKHLIDALTAVNMNVDIDLISIDLRAALYALDELTGESVDEDIVNEIFSRFCVGK